MRRRALLWSVVAAVLILLLTVAIRVHRGAEQPPNAGVAPTTLVAPKCGTVKTTDAAGRPVADGFLAQVTEVHEAACRRDYDRLLALMDTPFGVREPSDALRELQVDDGAPLVVLAQTLEAAPLSGQGGLIYCHPHVAIAIFARGTLDRPGMWTDFTLTGDSPVATNCFKSRSAQRQSTR